MDQYFRARLILPEHNKQRHAHLLFLPINWEIFRSNFAHADEKHQRRAGSLSQGNVSFKPPEGSTLIRKIN